jgi:hypothetical protein
MANTYTLIEAKTLTATTASVTFSAIPATYTDLVLKVSMRVSAGFTSGWSIQLDSTSSVYSNTILYGNGSSASSYGNSAIAYFSEALWVIGASGTANTFSNGEIYIPNYALSGKKQISTFSASENNSTSANIGTVANLYDSATAVTTIKIYDPINSRNLLTDSSFYLYGIKSS